MTLINSTSSFIGIVTYRYETGGDHLCIYKRSLGKERLLADISLPSVRFLGKRPQGIRYNTLRNLKPPFSRASYCILHGNGTSAALSLLDFSPDVYAYIRQYMRNLPVEQ